MAEAINAENIGEYNGEVPAEEVVDENAGVDNAQEQVVEENENENPWDITKHQNEDGLVAGKYKNIDAMIKSLEHAEAKLTELQAEKQSTTAKGKNAEVAAEKEAAIAEVENQAINRYMETRTMTPELAAEITNAGGDPTRVELQGIKASVHYDKVTSMVGGKEQFNEMIEVMAEGKTESEKAAWLKSVSDPTMSEYAIKGLHAAYLEKTGKRNVPDRLRGKPSNIGSVKPYNSQQEVLAGAAAARVNKGARAEYEARKNATPDNILFGR